MIVVFAVVLAACSPQETATPEPTATEEATEEVATKEATEEVVVEEATEEAATEEATEEVVVEEATEEVVVEEATEEVVVEEATEEVVVEEATEEAMMDEATEEAMMDEATEEAMMDEATEEAMMDEATEEAMSDMGYMGEVTTYDDGAGLTFDYPVDFELTEGTDLYRLHSGDQVVVVVGPSAYATVLSTSEFESEADALAFYLDRAGYEVGDAADMMMAAASFSIELPRRKQIGFGNLVDLGDGNFAVVIELSTDSMNIPGDIGAVVEESISYAPPPPPEEEVVATEEAPATEEATAEATEAAGD
jgi:chemotaxis protein histidine kinase CheA